MAAVLDAMVPYVKNLIAGMAEEEVNMLLGVSGEITKLEDNTESIKAFLADAERRRITEQSIQRWVNKLKDAMYDATDILDLCQLEADKRKEPEGGSRDEKVPSCCRSLLFCLQNPVFAHKFGSRIKELNQRLDDIRKGANQFNFNINFSSYRDGRMNSQTEQYSSRAMSSEFDELAIVGKNVENDMKLIIQELIRDDDTDNNNVKVVSISGMGGIGKTTLAQKIFKETTIQEHFKTKIWLSIDKHFDEADLLRSAIKHAGRDHGEERDISILVWTLTDVLSASNFLVVMDDIWGNQAWSNVLSVPIRNASWNRPGSRVLVTTRLKDLASKMGESSHRHHVNPLDMEDAWSLLKKQLTPNQVLGIEQLKNIGMDILKKCDGLPLAIKVIGGLLSTRYPSELEWKAVLESPAWSVGGGLPEQLDNWLYLSYEDLSPQLKQCFLYCSLFPKGTEIIKNVIIPMWISEGFIQSLGASSSLKDGYDGLEEIAIQYYRELINRNLIQPMKEYSSTGYKCTMHDVVRSFAEHMTRDESLVVVDDKQASTVLRGGSSNMLVRRLSLGQTVSVAEWAVLQRKKSLRTLIISCRVNLKSGDSLGSFSSLRVLWIWSADSDRLIASLSKLKHLRYLHLEDTDVSRLPEDIHKMKFLLHMYLLNCKKLGHLPSSITKLIHLRSLDLSASKISAVPKGFGGLSNLRSLCGFPVHVDDMDAGSSSSSWCSLQELAPLCQLRELVIDGLEKVPACWMAEKAMISSKAHLNYLELNYNNHSDSKHTTTEPCGDQEANEKKKQQQQEVLEKLCPPTCIENLRVLGEYVGCHLPNWMCTPASAEFKSLRYLTLKDLPCCTHLPDGLCCLPSLELADITSAPAVKRIGPEFQASSASAAHPPFPKLRSLNLAGLCGWEEWDWNVADGFEDKKGGAKAVIAMPCLEILYITSCKLRCLPTGLANNKRHALRELYLYGITNLASVENFPSVVELDVFDCPELKKISKLCRLHKIRIIRCLNLEVLEGVPALDSLRLDDATMEALPAYLSGVNPRYLSLSCNKKLYGSLSLPGSSEWNKINHIGKRDINCIQD